MSFHIGPAKKEPRFLPTRLDVAQASLVPRGNYRDDYGVIPYQQPRHLVFLPKMAAEPGAILRGELPLVYGDPEKIKPRILESFMHLLGNLDSITAWEDMLIALNHLPGQGGKIADLYVIHSMEPISAIAEGYAEGDEPGERFIVLDAEPDFGSDSGYLNLRHLGEGGRGGRTIQVDVQRSADHLLPLLFYREKNVARRQRRLRRWRRNRFYR